VAASGSPASAGSAAASGSCASAGSAAANASPLTRGTAAALAKHAAGGTPRPRNTDAIPGESSAPAEPSSEEPSSEEPSSAEHISAEPTEPATASASPADHARRVAGTRKPAASATAKEVSTGAPDVLAYITVSSRPVQRPSKAW